MTETNRAVLHPGKVTRIESFEELLAVDGVVEELEIRSTIGVCALHGGGLEQATQVVAREVAERTGSSYYALIQPDGSRRHLPSTRFIPGVSEKLDTFLENVDFVLSIHGYGRDDDFWAVLVGGSNREMAHHITGHLRAEIPDEYRVVDDTEVMPPSLRGLHPDNPVNKSKNGGVQVEIPPGLRWNREYRDWSDRNGTPRGEHLDYLIEALTAALLEQP